MNHIQDHASNFLTFTLQNEGYGFGFTVKEGPKENDGSKKESVIVSTVFPDSVAYKVIIIPVYRAAHN